MPLSALVRIREWLAGDVLTAVALNTEHDNQVDFINDEIAPAISDLEDRATALEGRADDLEALNRVVVIKVIDDATELTTGDGKTKFVVPAELNGMNLVSVGAHVFAVSSSGLPTVQLYNATQAADMLTTRITIDENEKDSKDATTPAVIDTANDDVATGDEIRVDVDVAGTATAGLEVRMGFRLP